jgi:hypothetical protein
LVYLWNTDKIETSIILYYSYFLLVVLIRKTYSYCSNFDLIDS